MHLNGNFEGTAALTNTNKRVFIYCFSLIENVVAYGWLPLPAVFTVPGHMKNTRGRVFCPTETPAQFHIWYPSIQENMHIPKSSYCRLLLISTSWKLIHIILYDMLFLNTLIFNSNRLIIPPPPQKKIHLFASNAHCDIALFVCLCIHSIIMK